MPRSRNNFLAACSDKDFELLAPHLEPVDLPSRQTIEPSHELIEYVYFLESGIASVVATTAEGEKVEVSLFGRDCTSGITVINGAERTPLHTFMQVSGHGQRIRREAFQNALAASPSLQRVGLLCNQARIIQVAYTALANARHTIEERLARWILMCHDRIDGDELTLTHDFLALMLGVRRAGVTTGMHILEGAHIIKATRGMLQVRDREKLKAVAGASYGVPEAEYERLLGRPIS